MSLLSSGWLMLSNLTRGKCRAEFVRSDIHLNGRFAPTAADQRSSMLDACFSPKRDYVTAALHVRKVPRHFVANQLISQSYAATAFAASIASR